ncbi:TIGR04500 family putative peptide maturation system protein [Nonomuraea sp. NPDC050310]|uniref:TIGR04500 family putative peptide maturation system protein n=1 Tax=Nonomuraea sp. NPDC050310 TaxID=3154935 RepID=UPI0033E78306
MLPDALGVLRELAGLEPPEAQTRVDDLRERHPEARFRLLWQREESDGSLHYDLLIKQDGAGTVSLSWCPDRALPWPLRGVHRAGEHLLLRVDGVDVRVADAVASLDFLWDEARLTDRIISAALLRAEVEQSRLELTDEELQEAVDAFRRARGLLTAASTQDWMDRRGLTQSELEGLVAGEVAIARIRERVTEGKVDAYFEAHRAEFAIARIARLELPHPAADLADETDLYTLAEHTPGARLTIEDVPASQAFASPLVKVISIHEAVLDAATRRRVERRIFDEWLAARRAEVKIEWFWSTTTRTSAL